MSVSGNAPVVVVLASGQGQRFTASGGQGSKLQALLAGRPVLEWTLQAVRESGLRWHLENAGHAGMGDSIAAGVAATRDAGGWLILPGDLPLVQPESLRQVAQALPGHAVVLPSYLGQRGHPVGFGAGYRDALLALNGAEGAAVLVRDALRQGNALHLSLTDAGIVTDVDTVEDLARAERALAGAGDA